MPNTEQTERLRQIILQNSGPGGDGHNVLNEFLNLSRLERYSTGQILFFKVWPSCNQGNCKHRLSMNLSGTKPHVYCQYQKSLGPRVLIFHRVSKENKMVAQAILVLAIPLYWDHWASITDAYA